MFHCLSLFPPNLPEKNAANLALPVINILGSSLLTLFSVELGHHIASLRLNTKPTTITIIQFYHPINKAYMRLIYFIVN